MSSEVNTDTLFPLSDISVVIREAETEMLSSSTTICAKAGEEKTIDNMMRDKLSEKIFINSECQTRQIEDNLLLKSFIVE